MSSTAALLVAGVLCVGAILLVYKLFWPRSSSAPDADDPWAQHNERRMPSLERAPEARDNAIDAAVGAQDMGIR
jgi:hypothetical protein